MPRKIPSPPEVVPVPSPQAWKISLTLVTPMLGGGHKVREVDPITPISAKAIRGHLRFWWRYMCGSRLDNSTGLPDTELMRLRESEVFGGQELGSPFNILIDDVRSLDLKQHRDWKGADAYALFPLRETPTDIAMPGLSFTLVVQWIDQASFHQRLEAETKRRRTDNHERRARGQHDFPAPFDLKMIYEQFNSSLWAWVNFGGLGSRTRRGLGCLQLSDQNAIGRHSFEKKRGPRYALHPAIYYSKQRFDNPSDAWDASLTAYRDFRQAPRGPAGAKTSLKLDRDGLHCVPLQNVQGRSKWPEPDSIRMATACALAPGTLYLKDGKVSPTPTNERIDFRDHRQPFAKGGTLPAYPRAALGLPIIFHFADGPKLRKYDTYAAAVGISPSDRDPDDATLVPMIMGVDGEMTAGDRMASPVITKPIQLHDGWHAAIIILRPPGLDELQARLLKTSGGHTDVRADQITGPEIREFAPMRGKENALDALAAFLTREGFKLYGAGE